MCKSTARQLQQNCVRLVVAISFVEILKNFFLSVSLPACRIAFVPLWLIKTAMNSAVSCSNDELFRSMNSMLGNTLNLRGIDSSIPASSTTGKQCL